MKKLTVTVGIAAYNEEKNIVNILNDVFKQDQKSWTLKKIIVYSDGSSDKTAEKVKKIRSKKIDLLVGSKRLGKAHGLNQILSRFNSDIIVFFDADESLPMENVIEEIARAFDEKKVMLVGGNTQPIKPATFFQNAVFSTFKVFNDSRGYVKDGNNIFGATGGCLALKKSFAKTLSLPSILNDDDYIYFSAISKQYRFKYVKEAKVFYKLPTNLRDYLRQCFRSNPEAATVHMSKYFGDLVSQEYKRPLLKYVGSISKELVRNPLGTFYISAINIFVLISYPFIVKKYSLSNFTATSTK